MCVCVCVCVRACILPKLYKKKEHIDQHSLVSYVSAQVCSSKNLSRFHLVVVENKPHRAEA